MFPRLRVVPRRPECTETTGTSQGGQGNRRSDLYCRLTYLERGCSCCDCIWAALHSGHGSGPEVSINAF